LLIPWQREGVSSEIHVNPENFLPPLQTGLALMKNFVIAVNQNGIPVSVIKTLSRTSGAK
jgi:hypothetical protein